jgi:hypothetical protein
MEDILQDDLSWIDSYVENEELYKIFYSKNTSFFNCVFIYISKKNIEIIKKDRIDISNNVIEKKDLIKIINKNRNKHKLVGMLQYNFSLDNDDVERFIDNPKDFKFFKKYKKIQDVYWNKTIPLFNSLNTLYLLLLDKKPDNKTKKLKLKTLNKTKKNRFDNELKILKNDYIKIDNKSILRNKIK